MDHLPVQTQRKKPKKGRCGGKDLGRPYSTAREAMCSWARRCARSLREGQEITVAGSLWDMHRSLEPAANAMSYWSVASAIIGSQQDVPDKRRSERK